MFLRAFWGRCLGGHDRWGAEWKGECTVSEGQGQGEQGPEAEDGETGDGDFLCLVLSSRENGGKASKSILCRAKCSKSHYEHRFEFLAG